MKVGLIDADATKFPNLALMKMSAYHKGIGDTVEWVNYWDHYDKVYISKVFTFSPDPDTTIMCDDIDRGGTGYDIHKKLPTYIEYTHPDYSIYPNVNYAVGFMTRGCSRNCPFCIVNAKEGRAYQQCFSVNEFWSGQKEIKLLDPNLLEHHNAINILRQLQQTSAWIDFTQGLDIRLMTQSIVGVLCDMKIKRVHFAYDQIKNCTVIEKNLKMFMSETGWKRHKVTVYILCNYDTTIEEDLQRIEFVKSIGATPYVMIYNKNLLPKQSQIIKMQRWCNAPQILFSTEWKDYQII